jgi:hypothetical protein
MGLRFYLGLIIFLSLCQSCLRPKDADDLKNAPSLETEPEPSPSPPVQALNEPNEVNIYFIATNFENSTEFPENKVASKFFLSPPQPIKKPSWLSHVTIQGITNNNLGLECARFSQTGDNQFTSATAGELRVNERFCGIDQRVSILVGLNADFPIKASLTYVAYDKENSSRPKNPSFCFLNGIFRADLCSPILYQSFLMGMDRLVTQTHSLWIPPLNHGVEVVQSRVIALNKNSGPKIFSIEKKINKTMPTACASGDPKDCLGVVFKGLHLKRFTGQ